MFQDKTADNVKVILSRMLGLCDSVSVLCNFWELLSNEYLQRACPAEMFMFLTKGSWGGGPTTNIVHSSAAIRIQKEHGALHMLSGH